MNSKNVDALIKTKGKADIPHEIAMGIKYLSEFTPESGTKSLDEAIACFLRALAMEKKKIKSRSDTTTGDVRIARTYELLGDTYKQKGALTLAKEHYMEAMAACENHHRQSNNKKKSANKETKTSTTNSHNNKMDDYQRMQNKEHRVTCEIYRSDQKHKRVSLRRKYSDTIKLGQMNLKSGKYDEARNRYQEALAMCMMRYGVESSMEVARVRELLGDLCVQAKSDFEEAQGHYRAVLQILERNKIGQEDERYEAVVQKFIPIAGLQ